MADPFLGEIRIFGFNFAPRNWAFCDGQLLPISQNNALYSLLGTNFGGNGTKTFGLPNLLQNVPVGAGNAPGLSPRVLGATGGTPYVQLTSPNMPQHSHTLAGFSRPATKSTPDGNSAIAHSTGGSVFVASTAGQAATMQAGTLSAGAGSGLHHNNVMPFQKLNFCIALAGTFPAKP
jgi:microcystin-dependent protein